MLLLKLKAIKIFSIIFFSSIVGLSNYHYISKQSMSYIIQETF